MTAPNAAAGGSNPTSPHRFDATRSHPFSPSASGLAARAMSTGSAGQHASAIQRPSPPRCRGLSTRSSLPSLRERTQPCAVVSRGCALPPLFPITPPLRAEGGWALRLVWWSGYHSRLLPHRRGVGRRHRCRLQRWHRLGPLAGWRRGAGDPPLWLCLLFLFTIGVIPSLQRSRQSSPFIMLSSHPFFLRGWPWHPVVTLDETVHSHCLSTIYSSTRLLILDEPSIVVRPRVLPPQPGARASASTTRPCRA